MNKLATGFAAALLTVGISCAAVAGAGNSGDNGGGNGGGNAGGNGGGNAGGQSAGASANDNSVGSNGMSRTDWTGGWREYFDSTQVGNGKGLARRNYGLAVRVQAWRGGWGEQVGGEGGQAQADGDSHRSERLQGYLDSHLGIGSQK